MCSTVKPRMWSTNDKIDASYPLLAAAGRGSDKHGANKPLSIATKTPRSDATVEAKQRKNRELTSSSFNASKQTNRIKSRTAADGLGSSELDPFAKKFSKVVKKPKKDNNLYPGRIYREKTFGKFTTPPAEDYERPGVVPRRRIQVDESEYPDRGYVSDIKNDRPRSFFEEKKPTTVERVLRPKSAGQALYAVDSDDDSSLGGDIEVLDIDDDDDTFILAGESGTNKNVGEEVSPRELTGDDTAAIVTIQHDNAIQANRYHGNNDVDDYQQNEDFFVDEREQRNDNVNTSPESAYNLSLVTHDRRRAKSDSSVIPQCNSARDQRRESEINHREIASTWQRKNSYPVRNKPSGGKRDAGLHADMYSEKTYSRAVEKVLSKYTHLSMSSDSSATRANATGKSPGYGSRPSMPRKLKPLLNREKLGQANDDRVKDIDYRVPFS